MPSGALWKNSPGFASAIAGCELAVSTVEGVLAAQST